jgi:hypothetical protein
MKHDLTPDAAMRQAAMTAKHYLICASTDIDDVFGDGYATEHPELMGAYMITAALDFHSASISSDTGDIANAIDGAGDFLRRIRERI